MTILETKNLGKTYSSFKLENVNLKIESGEITALVGENGAGKSTTIGILSGIRKQSCGNIEFKGKDVSLLTKKEREKIAFAYDDSSFPLDFTLSDVGRYGKLLYSDWDEEKWESLKKRLSLTIDKPLKEFSKGMKAKAEIAYCLSHNPDLLILDETTSSLDPVVRDELMELFQEYVMDGEKAILFSSHITSDLEKIADRIIFIHQGKIILSIDHNQLDEDWGIAHTDKNFQIEKDDNVFYFRERVYSKDLLLSKREEFRNKHPQIEIEKATIESIMLLLAKGEGVLSVVLEGILSVVMKREFIISEVVEIVALGFALTSFSGGTTIPLTIKYGSEKARLILLSCYMIPAVAIMWLLPNINPEMLNPYILIPALIFFSLLFLSLSCLLSLAIFKKKDF